MQRNTRAGFAKIFSSVTLFAALHQPAATLSAQTSDAENSPGVVTDVEFRGCESARLCRFWIDALAPDALLRVQPDGGFSAIDNETTAIAVRNRLNSLMSNMIHQYKHIDLQALRKSASGSYMATVVVDGMALTDDPILKELMQRRDEKR